MSWTNLFPVQVSALCPGTDEDGISPAVQLNYKSTNYTGQASAISGTDPNAKYHDFRWATNDSRPDWFAQQMKFMNQNYRKGTLGYTAGYVKKQGKKQQSIAILNGKIYDFTDYIVGGRAPKYPPGYDAPDTPPTM